MANKFDLKQNIRDSVTKETDLQGDLKTDSETKQETSLNDEIIIKRKTDDKKNKKSFNVYMEPELVKVLDKISKQAGYSRNELINFYCDYGASKTKVE